MNVVARPELAWTVACLFLGVFAVMTAYGAVLCLLTRQREHLFFTLLTSTFLLGQAVLIARLLPSLAPHARGPGEGVPPACVALAFFCSFLFQRSLRPEPALADTRSRLRLAKMGWLALIAGVLIGALRAHGYLPTHALTFWAPQIGATLSLLVAAVQLAERCNTLHAGVRLAKDELAAKVGFLEEAVARATENTERAEQVARVKDEFMATMSHELRTPLNAIINLPPGLLRDFPQLLRLSCARCSALFELEAGEDPAEERVCPECSAASPLARTEVVRYVGTPESTLRYLEKIERSGVHLLQVVNGILDAEQVKTGQLALTFGETDIAEMTREVIEEMSDLSERGGVKLVLENVPDGSRLVVDRLRLRQVLINLISNAIKFSDRRGCVYVSVQAASDRFRFAVRDEGIGIAKENLEAVFGSFEQVHPLSEQRRFGGSGLGLFISRSLVRKHGGEMWVESTLGKGSTFRFQIPRRERARSTANLRDSQVLSQGARL